MFVGHTSSISGTDSLQFRFKKDIYWSRRCFCGGLQDNGNIFQFDRETRSTGGIDVSGSDRCSYNVFSNINKICQNYVYNRSVSVWNLNTNQLKSFILITRVLQTVISLIQTLILIMSNHSNYESGGQIRLQLGNGMIFQLNLNHEAHADKIILQSNFLILMFLH